MYIGPEVMMPLASILAAIGGIAMMFWSRTVSVMRSAFSFVTRKLSRS